MPVPISFYWKERVRKIKANNPIWGAGRIAKLLDQEMASKDGKGSAVPSEATIRRVLRREWDSMGEERQAQYVYFYWPESMESGKLPWEYSKAGIELLRWRLRSADNGEIDWPGVTDKIKDSPSFRESRPTNREVEWFWRVTQAMPSPSEGSSSVEYTLFRDLIAQALSDLDLLGLSDEYLKRDFERIPIFEAGTLEHIRILLDRMRVRLDSN